MHWRDIPALIGESVSAWNRHKAQRLGAALAFYALLSLMPLLLVVISVAGLIFGHTAAESGIMRQVQILIGLQRAEIVRALLQGAQNKADGVIATLLGTLTLMFGASGMLIELREDLNTIWDVPTPPMTVLEEIRSVVKERLWSLTVVLGISVLLTGSLLVGAWISAAGALYASVLPANPAILQGLHALLSWLAVTIIFGAIYKIVPDIALEWRDVLLSAAVTSLLFTPGNLLLGLYLGKVSFSSTYGAAASVIVLALWVYYSSQVLFLGAEFTRAFAQRYGSKPRKWAGFRRAESARGV